MGRNRKVAPSVASSAISSRMTSAAPSRAASPGPPVKPFRFFELPAELRIRIYEQVLCTRKPLDLDPLNYRMIHPRLSLLLVSRRMHEEAYQIFYGQTVRLFPHPYHGKFFNTKKPLIQRLPIKYREAINSVELLLGPGWHKPPRCHNVLPALGLADCTTLRTLKIWVDCDPTDSVFNGFRGPNATEDTYVWFCVDMLHSILEQVPSMETIEIDHDNRVKKDSPLTAALKMKAEEFHKRFGWGPSRRAIKDKDTIDIPGLEKAMASMGISNVNEAPRVVEIVA
ncbi:hypothetical protein Slin15195_G023150 [Septoria linicola]|uniref:F-box domain-containing protein n=1 Tax=Septoria linicola TaxID=215465 RepID=A0A9Q9AN42_9PEZI|nr:hypothetical protein Slin15195_G023150 [Septoria linicola]